MLEKWIEEATGHRVRRSATLGNPNDPTVNCHKRTN